MPIRKAQAKWEGNLKNGKGKMAFGSGAYEGAYSFLSRFEEGEGTNPEELIAAAHAGCFSMAFSNELDQAGFPPESVETEAAVTLEKGEGGFQITRIDLTTTGIVPGIGEEEFKKIAEEASRGCPVSQALKAVEIKVHPVLRS
ncbi:MAG: OsmC family protein [Anaerolineales bacterium]|nr:OsmC family protein [Anaerolineales bacterium]